jgi:hypothetical protein
MEIEQSHQKYFEASSHHFSEINIVAEYGTQKAIEKDTKFQILIQ